MWPLSLGLFLLCANVVTSNRLTVYVQEAPPVDFTDDTILKQFLYLFLKSPASDTYKPAVLKEGLNSPNLLEQPDHQTTRDTLAAGGDWLGLLVSPRTFYSQPLLDAELAAADMAVYPGVTVGFYQDPAVGEAKVLVVADPDYFRRYDFGPLKEVGKYDILPEGLNPITA